MSIRVMNWVWEHSGAAGTELLLLLAIADAADDHGGNAYPSVATLARKTRMSERSVQRLVTKLAEAGRITVRRGVGGRCSNTYTVVLDSCTEAPEGEDHTADGARSQPVAAAEAVTGGSSRRSDRPYASSTTGDNLSPRQSDTGDTATSPQGRHSSGTPGATQLCHPTRPVTVLYPSTDSKPGDNSGPAEGGGGKPQPATELAGPQDSDTEVVLDELCQTWPLGPSSRRRLQPSIRAAIESGWTPQALSQHLTANPDGIRNPYAVISSRLSDLPPAPRQPTRWPDWCGHCDHDSRHRQLDDGRVARCRTCHPYAHTA